MSESRARGYACPVLANEAVLAQLPGQSKEGGQVVQGGVVAAAQRFMARWHVEKESN